MPIFASVSGGCEELKKRGLTLLPEGGLWMPEASWLIIADVHVGKAVHFRKHGIPVPWQVEARNLEKLSLLLSLYKPRRLVVLGDLFHSDVTYASEAFGVWRNQWDQVSITLVQGNHDRGSEDFCRQIGLEIHRTLTFGDVVLRHEPREETPARAGLVISGHLHPGFSVGRYCYPCFWYSPARLVMPAFGAFTGFFRVKPRSGDQLFVSYNQQLWPLAF